MEKSVNVHNSLGVHSQIERVKSVNVHNSLGVHSQIERIKSVNVHNSLLHCNQLFMQYSSM